MLAKRSRPLIKKLSGCPLHPSDIINSSITTSPRSPLDFGTGPIKNKNMKCTYDHDGGVGLGIIIALEKSKSDAGEKILVKYGLRGPSPASSGPIPVRKSSRPCCFGGGDQFRGVIWENDAAAGDNGGEEEEDYTFVTCRGGPNKPVTTRVYYGGGEPKMNHCRNDNKINYMVVTTTTTTRRQKQNGSVFKISTAFGGEEEEDKEVESSSSDFLSYCHMCRKTLLGKDIFMYRGEKAFCSEECRQRQIARDERKEKFCRSEAAATAAASSSRSATPSTNSDVVSRSPYHHYERGQIFSAGIVAV